MSDTVAGDLQISDSRTTSRTREARFAYWRLSSEQVTTHDITAPRTGLPNSRDRVLATRAAIASSGRFGRTVCRRPGEPIDRVPQLGGTERLRHDGIGPRTHQSVHRRTRRLIDKRNDASGRSSPTTLCES